MPLPDTFLCYYLLRMSTSYIKTSPHIPGADEHILPIHANGLALDVAAQRLPHVQRVLLIAIVPVHTPVN